MKAFLEDKFLRFDIQNDNDLKQAAIFLKMIIDDEQPVEDDLVYSKNDEEYRESVKNTYDKIKLKDIYLNNFIFEIDATIVSLGYSLDYIKDSLRYHISILEQYPKSMGRVSDEICHKFGQAFCGDFEETTAVTRLNNIRHFISIGDVNGRN